MCIRDRMNIGSSILEDYRNVTFWEKPGDESDYPVISAINYYHYGQFDALIDSNIEDVYKRQGVISALAETGRRDFLEIIEGPVLYYSPDFPVRAT